MYWAQRQETMEWLWYVVSYQQIQAYLAQQLALSLLGHYHHHINIFYFLNKVSRGFWADDKTGICLSIWTTTLVESVWSNYFGALESTEGLQLPGEDLDSNLWLTLVNFSSQQNSSCPPPRRQPCTCSWSSTGEPGWSKRARFSRQQRSVLIADRQRGWSMMFLSLSQVPSLQLKWLPGKLKGQCPLISPFGSQKWKIRTFKTNCV